MNLNKKTQPWFHYPRYAWQEKTATVIGAGIAGSQMSWHLARSGWKVTVIERQTKPATEASGNAAGIISPKVTAKPSLGEEFYLHCYHYTLQQINGINTAFDNNSIDWNPVGVLQLAYKDRDIKRWKNLQQRAFSEDMLQCVDAKMASRIANTTIPYPAVYLPSAGWVEPASFCKALLSHPNVTLMTETHALEIAYNGSEWNITTTHQQPLSSSEALVICSGKDLDFEPIQSLPSQAIAGQTSLAKQRGGSKPLKTVLDHEGYITPSINNKQQLLLGATYDRGSTNNSLSLEADMSNFHKLQTHLPLLANDLQEIESGHAAIRRITPDRLPLLGAVPDLSTYQQDYADLHHGKQWKHYANASYHPNLFISAAYGSRGLTTAGLCANILVAMMNGEDLPVNKELVQALHPARFKIRQLKKGQN